MMRAEPTSWFNYRLENGLLDKTNAVNLLQIITLSNNLIRGIDI